MKLRSNVYWLGLILKTYIERELMFFQQGLPFFLRFLIFSIQNTKNNLLASIDANKMQL